MAVVSLMLHACSVDAHRTSPSDACEGAVGAACSDGPGRRVAEPKLKPQRFAQRIDF